MSKLWKLLRCLPNGWRHLRFGLRRPHHAHIAERATTAHFGKFIQALACELLILRRGSGLWVLLVSVAFIVYFMVVYINAPPSLIHFIGDASASLDPPREKFEPRIQAVGSERKSPNF